MAKQPEKTPCGTCKMPVGPSEYHPYAACLMFMFCNDAERVRANLWAVVDYGRKLERRG
jgi:hypothetical protein